jgi:hypothetical protein
VSLPSLLTHPNLTLEVLLLSEDHVRAPAPVRAPRRRRTSDPGQRRLVDVLGRIELTGPDDLVALLPALPPEPFTTRELAAAAQCRLLLAQRIVYCLRAIGALEPAGRRGRAPVYRRAGEGPLASKTAGAHRLATHPLQTDDDRAD